MSSHSRSPVRERQPYYFWSDAPLALSLADSRNVAWLVPPAWSFRTLIGLMLAAAGAVAVAVCCSVGVLQSINAKSRETQALVLSPTRELAMQSRNVMMAFGDYMNVTCHACVGGKSLGEDIRALQSGVQVISGTPGRVHGTNDRRSSAGFARVGCMQSFVSACH